MSRTVFSGGRVFDGSTNLAAVDIAVEDGLIVDVGPSLDGDTAIDLGGRAVLPGLFDCHTHVMINPDWLDTNKRLETPFSYWFYAAIGNLRRTLDLGITTVRDAGFADLGLKTAVAEGLIAGPRLHIAISILSQTGGHSDGWLPSGYDTTSPDWPGRPHAIVDGPDEMRRRVRELVQAGADQIKVCTSGGVLSPRDDPRHGHFRAAELDVLVEEATAAELHVMAHAQGAPGIKAAVRAGIRSIEHGIYLDDEAIQLMLERGTWLVPDPPGPAGRARCRGGRHPDPAGEPPQGARGDRGPQGGRRQGHRRGCQGRDGNRLGRDAARRTTFANSTSWSRPGCRRCRRCSRRRAARPN